jgi:hypothetical protein
VKDVFDQQHLTAIIEDHANHTGGETRPCQAKNRLCSGKQPRELTKELRHVPFWKPWGHVNSRLYTHLSDVLVISLANVGEGVNGEGLA